MKFRTGYGERAPVFCSLPATSSPAWRSFSCANSMAAAWGSHSNGSQTRALKRKEKGVQEITDVAGQ
ncbi:hypothetical protein SKAU_G00099650 [Synaphobranchus kaupii]|uniref:Uncharacterized protein n=1 Tax=Synaphobranchus kaupii TaxID=118154 RepID=A0A9Q1FYW5_SYNKA|nr:hypothetical protein SKAU_G00099650 [Synaphobranchus kaupii]